MDLPQRDCSFLVTRSSFSLCCYQDVWHLITMAYLCELWKWNGNWIIKEHCLLSNDHFSCLWSVQVTVVKHKYVEAESESFNLEKNDNWLFFYKDNNWGSNGDVKHGAAQFSRSNRNSRTWRIARRCVQISMTLILIFYKIVHNLNFACSPKRVPV